MLSYFLKKISALFCSLFIIMSLTFFLMRLIPGDPFAEEQALRQDMQEILHQQSGLDRPLFNQYCEYLFNLFQEIWESPINIPSAVSKVLLKKGLQFQLN